MNYWRKRCSYLVPRNSRIIHFNSFLHTKRIQKQFLIFFSRSEFIRIHQIAIPSQWCQEIRSGLPDLSYSYHYQWNCYDCSPRAMYLNQIPFGLPQRCCTFKVKIVIYDSKSTNNEIQRVKDQISYHSASCTIPWKLPATLNDSSVPAKGSHWSLAASHWTVFAQRFLRFWGTRQ